MSKFAPFGAQTFYLGSSISSTATTILLSSFVEPVTGTPYTMALLNTDIAYGTIGPKTSSAEFISFTGITQNSDGTATLTGVTRGLAKKYPFATDSAYKLPHAGQSVFIISDAPQLFNKYVSLENAETISGKKTFPASGNANAPVAGTVYATPTDDLEYATKKYVDTVALQGAPDASTTVKGVSKMSVAPASATGPIAVGDNDPRVPTAAQVGYIPTSAQKDALAGTGTPSGSNKFVTADTDALKELLANKDTDGTLAANSDTKYPSQKAVKTYADTKEGPVASVASATIDGAGHQVTKDSIVYGYGGRPFDGGASAASITCYSDSNSTPTTVVQKFVGTAAQASHYGSYCFFVKAGNYYKISASYGTGGDGAGFIISFT